MSPAESYASALEDLTGDARVLAAKIAAVAQVIRRENPVVTGWAARVERTSDTFFLIVSLRHASVSLPLTEDTARGLAAMLLVRSEVT